MLRPAEEVVQTDFTKQVASGAQAEEKSNPLLPRCASEIPT